MSSKITADSVLDGDLTSNIKYSLEKTVNTGIDVKLKDYLIYLSVGDAFDPNAYFDSADKEGELTVQSNVNTAKAGS